MKDELRLDTDVVDFEKKHGHVNLLKACVSALNKLIVDKGVATQQEVEDYMAKEMEDWPEPKGPVHTT